MGTKKTIMIAFSLCFFFYGCGYGLYFVHVDPKQGATTPITKRNASEGAGDMGNQYYYTTNSPDPVTLTHADTGKKKAYIQKADETLRHFYQVAHDTRKRKDISCTNELGREANNYVKNYVEPILNDAGAIEHLETRAEVAKLHLLTASLYYELAGYYQAKYYLTQLSERFGEAFLLGITSDIMDSRFSTVAEGVTYLQERISLKMTAKTTNNQ